MQLKTVSIILLGLMLVSPYSVGAQIIGHQATAYKATKITSGDIKIDGDSSDWSDIPAADLELESYKKLPGEYKIDVKIAYDGTTVYFLVEIPDEYFFTAGNPEMSPALAMATPINASEGAHMGAPSEDNLDKSEGFVDIMHWETGLGEHGVVAGDNGTATGKGIGGLDDEFASTPFDRHDDVGENGWTGVWDHTTTTYTNGDAGKYIFEYSRSMNAAEDTDASYKDGGESEIFFAYWNPQETGDGWTANGHYTNEGALVVGFGFEPSVPNLWLIQGSVLAVIVILIGVGGYVFWKKKKAA